MLGDHFLVGGVNPAQLLQTSTTACTRTQPTRCWAENILGERAQWVQCRAETFCWFPFWNVPEVLREAHVERGPARSRFLSRVCSHGPQRLLWARPVLLGCCGGGGQWLVLAWGQCGLQGRAAEITSESLPGFCFPSEAEGSAQAQPASALSYRLCYPKVRGLIRVWVSGLLNTSGLSLSVPQVLTHSSCKALLAGTEQGRGRQDPTPTSPWALATRPHLEATQDPCRAEAPGRCLVAPRDRRCWASAPSAVHTAPVCRTLPGATDRL